MTKKYDLERRVVCAFVAGMFSLSPTLGAWAQSTTPAAAPSASSSGSATSTPTSPNLSNLDLTSRNKTVAAPYGGTIRQGLATTTFNPGDLVTPAQALALSQLMTTGTQSLILNTLGTAVGGTFKIAGSTVDTLVIPRGVTGLGNFSSGSALNLTGNLSNSGKFYLFSTDVGSNTAAISAQNIYNNRGGLLSSVLPSTLLGSLGGISALNMDLSAINNIVNAGIIRSSGTLSLTAGNSIINALPNGVTGAAPLLQAASAVNLAAMNIVNAGVISSLTSNINLAGINAGSLTVNNTGGTMKALLGNINVRDALFGAKQNFNLIGGDVLSKQFNVFTGEGAAEINARQISGLLNINAGIAHVTVEKGNLTLGAMNITGDPTFYNKGGDVTLSSDFSFAGQDLAIVAHRNIVSTANGVDLSTKPLAAGNAGDITLVAGAEFAIPNSAPDSGSFSDLTTLSIFSGSATGGKIDLKTKPITSFDASATNGNGGNILLVAYKGSTAGSGTIALPTNVVLTSTGSTGKTSGDVTVIAGATSGTGITLGGIDTSSGGGTGGAIKLTTATPTITVNPAADPQTASITVDIVNGGFTADSAIFVPGATTASSIVLGTVGTTSASNFTALTKGAFTTGVGGDITAGGTAANLNGGSISINAASVNLHNVTASGNAAGGNGGTINVLTSGGALALNGNLNANGGAGAATGNGGTINIAGGTISGGSTIQVNANATGKGAGGHVLIDSTGAFAVAPTGNGLLKVSATGGSGGSASGDGGSIQLNSGSNITVDPNGLAFGPLGDNGKGGTLILNAGFKKTAGNLLINGNLSADGVGDGDGGNIQLYSKSTLAFDIGGAGIKNGITGSISANSGTTAGADGGSLFVQNSSTGGIKVDPSKLQVKGSANGGDGGGITLYAGTDSPNLTASGIDIDFNRAIPAIVGAGFITSNLAAKGAVTILGGTLDASAAAAGGAGGTIGIVGTTVTNTGALTVNANGADTGNGGGIYIGTGATNAGINVGAPTNTLTLTAKGGANDGNGGTVALKATQGSISVNAASLQFGPAAALGNGSGGTLQLAAGDSKSTADRNVFVSGTITDLNGAPGGSGGTLYVLSNSSKAFTLGGAPVGGNGFVNAPTAQRGTTSNAAGGTMLFSNYHRNLAGAAFDNGVLDTAYNNVNGGPGTGSGGTVALMDLASDNVEAKSAVSINVPANNNYNFSGSGTGTSGGNGGSLILEAHTLTGFTTDLGGLAITAGGVDVGNGGTVVIRETSPTSSLKLSSLLDPTAISVLAGSGTNGGNGGRLFVGAANVNAQDTASFFVSPQGVNGNGGSLAFIAQKQLTLDTGTYVLTGNGTGSGGNIDVAGANDITLNYNVDGATGGSVAANSSGGNVSLTGFGSASHTLFGSSAKGTFNLTSAGGLFLAEAVKSSGAMSIKATTGDILTGPIATNKAVLTAPSIALEATTGTIGNFDATDIDDVIDERVLTATPHLTVTALGTTPKLSPNGPVNIAPGAYISNKGALTLDDAQADNAVGALMISTSGNLTVPTTGSAISANNIYLRTSGFSNGSVFLNKQVGTSGAEGSIVQISADGKGNIVQGAGSYNLQADTVLLDFESYVPDDPTQPAPLGNIGSATAPIRVQGVKHPSVTVNSTTWLNNPIAPTADTVNLGSLTFGKGIYIAVNGDANLSNFFDVEGTLSVKASANNDSDGNIIVTSQLATLGGGKSNTILLNADNNFYLARLAAVGFSDSLNVLPGPPPIAFIEPGSTVKITAGGSIYSTIYDADPNQSQFRGVIRGHDITLTAGGTIGIPVLDVNGDPNPDPLTGIFPKISAAASNLYLNAPNGNAYINGEDIQTLSFLPINIKQANLNPSGTFELFSFRPIVVGTAIKVDKVDLEVYQGLVGDITLNANVGNAGAGFTKVSADGSSNIIQNAGAILSPLVILGGMTTGDIGSLAKPIRTTASKIVIGTDYVTGTGTPHTGGTYIANTSAALTLEGGGIPDSVSAINKPSSGIISVSNTGSIALNANNPLQVSVLAEKRAADSITTTFDYSFAATSSSQLQVYDYNNTTQTATLLAAADYTVNLQTKTVTLDNPLGNNHTLVIAKNTSPSITLTTTNGNIDLGGANIIADHNIVDLPGTPAININTTGIASTVKLTAGGSGSIITSGGLIKGDNVTLSTNTGSIGSNANKLNISTSPNGTNTNITATTKGTASDIFINATSASTILSAVATNVNLLANGGNMTLNGTVGKTGTVAIPTAVTIANVANEDILAGTKVNVLGNNISLTANGTGDLGSSTTRIKLSPKTSLTVTAEKAFLQTTAATNLGGGVNVADTFDLLSAGAITGTINAPNVALKTTAGSIGTSANRVQLGAAASIIKLNSATDVFVNDLSAVGSSVEGSSRGTFDVQTGSDLTVNNVTASKLINIKNTAGKVTLTGTNKAPTVTLATANKDITGNTAATTLSATAGSGNINIINAGKVTLNGIAGNTVDVSTTGAAGTLTVKGTVTGNNITLETTTGNISLANQVGGAGATVAVTVGGATSTITRTAAGMITGDDISLQSAGGAIGSASLPINTTGTGATPQLKAGMTGTSGTGNVYLNNVAINGTTFSQLPGTGFRNALTLTDSSPTLTLSGPINVGAVNTKATNNLIIKEMTGNIVVSNTGDAGNEANGIYVKGGSATLQAVNPNATITFNTDSLLKTDVLTGTNNGVVKVVVGPKLPTNGTALNPVTNVTLQTIGAFVIAGTGSVPNPVIAGTGTSTIVAKGRPVFVSAVNPNSIILNDSRIEADPPVGVGAVAAAHVTPVTGSAQAPAQRLEGNATAAQPSASQAQQVAFAAPSIPMGVISSATARDTIQPRTLTGGVSKQGMRNGEANGTGNGAGMGGAAAYRATTPQLEAGGTVLAPDHDIVVSTPFGPLKVGSKAIVLAILNADGLAIYDLHDEHLGDVSLGHSDAAVELHPGSHAFITRSAKDYETLNPLTFVAHRNLKSNEFGPGTVYTSEFSITSALAAHGPLSGLLRSGNADERRIMSRLLKDAAILMQTKAAQGQYKRIVPADLSLAK